MATHALSVDFSHADPKTLAGRKGEEFTVLSETSGWSTCSNAAGKTGLIPSSYLKALPASQPASQSSGDEYVEALHDYTNTTDSRVMSFKAKDVMKVIKKTPGWWTCEIVSTGKSGMVPQTYLKQCPAPVGSGGGGGASSPGPAPLPNADNGESEAAAKVPQLNPIAAAAAAAVAAAAARKKAAATAPTTAVMTPASAAIAPSSVAPSSVAPSSVAPASVAPASVAPTSAAPTPSPKPKYPSVAIPDEGKTVSSTPVLKSDLGKVNPRGSIADVKPSPSLSNLASKSVGSDQDLASLLTTFNTLQQETNTLLRQQMEELCEIKNTVRRIGETVRDIHAG